MGKRLDEAVIAAVCVHRGVIQGSGLEDSDVTRVQALAQLGARALCSVKKHDNACADGLIAPSEERVRICADVIRAIEELGLMGEVKP